MAIAEDEDAIEEDGPDPDGSDDADGGDSAVEIGRQRADENASEETIDVDDDRYTRKKCALITGCSSGIGRATARAFLDADWQVVATARNPGDIAELEEAGCRTLELDVTKPEQVARAVERTVDEAGAIDCVVNNAGFSQMGPLEDVSTADLHRQFDVNVYGPHRLMRAALPHMRAQGEGRIVNVSSVVGRLSFAGMGAYSGSKHALEAMSDALRAEAEGFGIDVVIVEPGPVDTNFTDRADDELPERDRTPDYEELYEIYEDAQLFAGGGPLASDPEDVASAIVQASTCAEPPARYPVGPVAQVALYGRFLPDRLRDMAYGLLRRLV